MDERTTETIELHCEKCATVNELPFEQSFEAVKDYVRYLSRSCRNLSLPEDSIVTGG